jgi:FkbM family methyltransferase
LTTKQYEFIAKKLRPRELALFVKWLMRVKRFIYTLPDGKKFFLDPISDFGLKVMKTGSYEKEMTEQISSFLKPGDCFVDLGSNEGYFSIIASALVGKTGKVIAIEPQQRLWEVITYNSMLNSCFNIQLMPFGISSKTGETTMNLYPSLNTGASSLSSNFNFKISFGGIRKKIYGQQKIYTKTLDELKNSIPNSIKLIKIDIEGFELEALKGSEHLLKQHTFNYILVEIHPAALSAMSQNEAELIDFVTKFGYRKSLITDNLLLFAANENPGN